MVKDKADRPEYEVEMIAEHIRAALSRVSDRNLVQGSARDCLIDGTFDLTIVARELVTKRRLLRIPA